MNVRSFPPEKFVTTYDEEIRQRAKWYYCPHALSEYKVPFLDFAYRQDVLDRMAPEPSFDGGYVSAMFSGTLPSTVDFTEQAAFRHYLHALHAQAASASAASFNETVQRHQQLLDSAEQILAELAKVGVKGQQAILLKSSTLIELPYNFSSPPVDRYCAASGTNGHCRTFFN